MERKVLNPLLKAAAAVSFLLAAGHLVCLLRLDAVIRLYGIETPMRTLAALWPPLPYAATVLIAAGLAGCGLYALSAAGTIRRLPLLRPIVYAVAGVFLLRAVAGVPRLFVEGAAPAPGTELLSIAIAAGLGALYLAGGLRAFRKRPS